MMNNAWQAVIFGLLFAAAPPTAFCGETKTPLLPAAAGPAPRAPSLSSIGSLSNVDPNLVSATPAPASPAALEAGTSYGKITGAITRSYDDPGPIMKMWFVYSSADDLKRATDVLRRVMKENPGVEIVRVKESDIFERKDDRVDTGAEAQARLAKRIADGGAELVLAANAELYDTLRQLRDAGYALTTPFGYVGRRHVSIDYPRASLNPAVLSDPRKLPHRNVLELTSKLRMTRMIKGKNVYLTSLRAALASKEAQVEESEKLSVKEWIAQVGLLRMSGQEDPRAVRFLREKAERLHAYLENKEIDVVLTDDPETADVLGAMKRMGYRVSLPVVWTGKGDPGDASGLTMTLHRGDWLHEAPHVRVASEPYAETAVREASKAWRLPDNFMEDGGVSVRNFEPTVRETLARALPPPPAGSPKRYQVHFLLSAGNGVRRKAGANPWGHFGMAVEDEDGDVNVWTVQYNDRRGGAFTGGLGKGKQLTLAEYLYALWYLPGATGQAAPMSETPVGHVLDFVLRGVDAAGLEAMRAAAAAINARHLTGEDRYDFFNTGGLTNCISMITQILRAGGFAIADSGVEVPADKAVEMIRGFGRGLLQNEIAPLDFGLVVFERPFHAAPSDYRIWNWALGSPFLHLERPWKEHGWIESVLALMKRPLDFLSVPATVAAFASMATHRVVVGPQSRRLNVAVNTDSPIAQLRKSALLVQRLREERVPLLKSLGKLEDDILKRYGLEGWRRVRDASRGAAIAGLSPEDRAALERDLAEHHKLDKKLALSNFDEQLELRRMDFLKLELADPLNRRSKELDPVRRAYDKVAARRARFADEDRLPSAEEISELTRLNAEVELTLERSRMKRLAAFGPRKAHDMRMVFRQVTRETLEKMREEGREESGGKKGKGSDGEGQ